MKKIRKTVAVLTSLVMSVSMLASTAFSAAAEVITISGEKLPEQIANPAAYEEVGAEHPTLPDGFLKELNDQVIRDLGVVPEQGEDGEFYYGDNYDTMAVLRYWLNKRGQNFDEMKSRSDEILSYIDPSWSDVTKVAYLHDYIAFHTKYDFSYQALSAYDVIVNGEGICQSYSSAMWYLLDRLGIESRIIVSYDLDHSWNCINLDGSWYLTDITWDDTTWGNQDRLNYVYHDYLLRSNAGFTDHDTSDWFFADDEMRGYYDYSTPYNVATNTKYDNYVWTNSKTGLVVWGDTYFYVDKDGIKLADIYNNTERLIDLRNVDWGYIGCFSTISAYGYDLYFNTDTEIYTYNVQTKNINKIYELSESEKNNYGLIFDMGINGDNLIYRLTATPNYDIQGYEAPYYDFCLNLNSDNVNRDEIRRFVDRLYTIILGRHAEEKGLEEWTNNLATGKKTSADIVYGIANSPEFGNLGLSNDEVIERMYQAMLGRGSDPSGKQNWLTAMSNGMTVTGIINGFSGSQEFANVCAGYGIKAGSITSCEPRDRNSGLTCFVARMYTEALGRSFDVDGLNTWTGAYLRGEQDARGIAYGFIFSQEFKNKNLNDNDYVEVLYKTFFGRASDEGGKAGWLNKLANGDSRESVLDGFLGSQEFANLKAGFGV